MTLRSADLLAARPADISKSLLWRHDDNRRRRRCTGVKEPIPPALKLTHLTPYRRPSKIPQKFRLSCLARKASDQITCLFFCERGTAWYRISYQCIVLNVASSTARRTNDFTIAAAFNRQTIWRRSISSMPSGIIAEVRLLTNGHALGTKIDVIDRVLTGSLDICHSTCKDNQQCSRSNLHRTSPCE